MKNKKTLKLVLLNILPVLIIHLGFAILDRQLLTETRIYQELRTTIGRYEMACYFLFIPLYLVLINWIYYRRNKSCRLTFNIALMYCSILIANITTLIYNSNTIPRYF